MREHQGAQPLRVRPQAAAHQAGSAAPQGFKKPFLALFPPVLPVQNDVHRLGHRLGDEGVEPFLHGDLQQPHPTAQSCLGRHDTGPRHAPAAADHQQLSIVPLVGLGVRGGKTRRREPGIRFKNMGLRPLHKGGGHPHLPHHGLPAELLAGVGSIGWLFPGKRDRHVRTERPGGHPARVAFHAAGQVGGDLQAGHPVGKAQQLGGQAGKLSPEAEAEHAVDEHTGPLHLPAGRLPVLSREDPHPFRQSGEGLPRQVRSGRALGQDDHALHALLGQHPGADKSIAPVVAPSAQHHGPLPLYGAAAAQHFLGQGPARVLHQLGEGDPRGNSRHLQALHLITAKELHIQFLLDRRKTLY